MAYELKELRGGLFKNEDKKADTHADYTGRIKIEGREYWLDCWLENANDPDKKTYLSLKAKPKEAKTGDYAGARPGSSQDPNTPPDESPF